MSTDVNYSIKGTTDVPQQVDKSKKAMSDFERQTAQVQMKFRGFGRDVFMSFFAPMVLLHSAINYISASIETRKREVKEALDFASTAEAKLYASQQEIEAAQRAKDQKKAEEDKKTAEEMKLQARIQFFKETPEGFGKVSEVLAANQAMRQGPYGAMAMGTGIMPQSVDQIAERLAQSKLTPELQAAFDKFFTETAAARPVKPEGPAGFTPNQFMAVASGTVGVGLSPQLDALNRQITIQEDMSNSLRLLVERDQAETGFKTEKFWPSPRRLDISR
jgi:hypothetical protein